MKITKFPQPDLISSPHGDEGVRPGTCPVLAGIARLAAGSPGDTICVLTILDEEYVGVHGVLDQGTGGDLTVMDWLAAWRSDIEYELQRRTTNEPPRPEFWPEGGPVAADDPGLSYIFAERMILARLDLMSFIFEQAHVDRDAFTPLIDILVAPCPLPHRPEAAGTLLVDPAAQRWWCTTCHGGGYLPQFAGRLFNLRSVNLIRRLALLAGVDFGTAFAGASWDSEE